MTEQQYLENRLEDQIKWYSKKSSKYKYLFRTLRGIEIIIAALIPGLFHFESVKGYIPLLGALVAILIGILSLLKLQENWLSYRTTSESLKHHKYLYMTNTKPYSTGDKFSMLVENVESLISKENSLWKQKNNHLPTKEV